MKDHNKAAIDENIYRMEGPLIFTNSVASVYFVPEMEMLSFHWRGALLLNPTIEVVEQTYMKMKWATSELHDLTKVDGPFPLIDNWVELVYLPSLKNSARKIAVVYPQDVFAKSSAQLAEFFFKRHSAMWFAEKSFAIDWIKSDS